MMLFFFLIFLNSAIAFWHPRQHFDHNIFLGKNLTIPQWEKLNEILSCWSSTDGKWVLRSSPQIIFTPPCKWSDGHYCDDGNYESQNYAWEIFGNNTNKCNLIDFNREKLLNLIGNKTILMVGDSITSKFMSTFRASLKENLPCELCNACNGEDSPSNLLVEGPGYSFRLISVRNDYLTIREPYEKGAKLEWLPLIEKYAVNTLILNRGAHYETDWDVLHDLHETFNLLSQKYPKMSVIYRNTYPGHLHHNQLYHAPPLKEPQDPLILPYHWGNFHQQNVLVEKMIRERFPWILYLDIETPMKYRADRHADELHYCSYGPPNHWILMLYNIYTLVLNDLL